MTGSSRGTRLNLLPPSRLPSDPPGSGRPRSGLPTDLTLSELERQVIPAVLDRTGGNVAEAARILGIDRSTLYDKIRRYEIERPGKKEGGGA